MNTINVKNLHDFVKTLEKENSDRKLINQIFSRFDKSRELEYLKSGFSYINEYEQIEDLEMKQMFLEKSIVKFVLASNADDGEIITVIAQSHLAYCYYNLNENKRAYFWVDKAFKNAYEIKCKALEINGVNLSGFKKFIFNLFLLDPNKVQYLDMVEKQMDYIQNSILLPLIVLLEPNYNFDKVTSKYTKMIESVRS